MLKGKTAVVTGSTSGIGLGIAGALAAEGCNVVLNGFGDAVEIERLRAKLAKEHGVRTAYVAADMAKPADIRGLVEKAGALFGGVDILVNNAGIQHVAKIVDFPEERWDAVIAVNLSAAFHAPRMEIATSRITKRASVVRRKLRLQRTEESLSPAIPRSAPSAGTCVAHSSRRARSATFRVIARVRQHFVEER